MAKRGGLKSYKTHVNVEIYREYRRTHIEAAGVFTTVLSKYVRVVECERLIQQSDAAPDERAR